MRTLLAVLVSMAATHAYPQALETDLDGNARSLVASEMHPRPSGPSCGRRLRGSRGPTAA